MSKSDADQSPVLSYAGKLKPAQARGVKWFMLTVAGWLLVIVGSVSGLLSAGWVVVLAILEIQSSRAGNTLVDNAQFYLKMSSRALVGALIFLAGIWLLRRRQAKGKLAACEGGG